MYLNIRQLLFLVVFLAVSAGAEKVCAQFSAPYADSWITYNKPYVKIGIAKKGLHRIPFSSLPKTFTVGSPEKLQLWRRGKQVSIISVVNNEILFYAVTNDGSSDSLLYRPMSARLNPYNSMYSDEGSYFLTNGDSNGLRAKVVNQAVDAKVEALPYHTELTTTVFTEEYSLSTKSAIQKDYLNSYFELAASKTGVTTKVGTLLSHSFELKNIADKLAKAYIKLLVHGRSNNDHKIEVLIGKNAESLRLVGSVNNSGYAGTEYSFELKAGDVGADNKGLLALRAVGTAQFERFSLAYYSIGYAQSFSMDGQLSKEFRLNPSTITWNRAQIIGTPVNSVVMDVTDSDNPVMIQGSYQNLMIPRIPGKLSTLLATKEVTSVLPEKMKEVTFKQIAAKEPNYIIITTDPLIDGATQYANYRASVEGGGFKPFVIKIKDIYNQFNYGEPSPLAIKRFMTYMIGEGGKDKYLFLIGKSITNNERMIRELPDEVPSMGFPASDILLVSGLLGADQDIPAVPVGRLSGISNQNVLDYLQKVKDYEQNVVGDYGWRKNVLHLNGGKNVGEITQLKALLNDLEPTIVNGVVGGRVTPYVKQQPIAEVESVNITSDVNNGVGLITYFGHGSPVITDLDMGYITDVSRGYNNSKKYPMMYFNGCGVGDIFMNRFNPNPNAGDRITLSLDWILAPNKGAIAIIANSFESFVSPSARYLQQLYANMFIEPTTVNLSIGKIQQAVANTIVTKNRDQYSVSNVHQTVLQGDPALKLITVDKPDYSLNPEESITLYSKSGAESFEKSDSIRLAVFVSNEGRYLQGQQIPILITYFGSKGNKIGSKMLKSFPFKDTVSVSFLNSKDIQKIQVIIDPNHLLSELSIKNNVSELEVDWDVIKDKYLFSSANNKDVVPPILSVKFNGTILKDKQVIDPNPSITFNVQDDRFIFPDTALIDIFVKRCGDNSCDFEKVVYSKIDMAIDSIGNHAFQITYSTNDFAIGQYELLVNVKDRAGNSSIQPYRISFTIAESMLNTARLLASPNPASSYVKFNITAEKGLSYKTAKFMIYNQAGILVEEKQVSFPNATSQVEWYWSPSSVSSGLYAYKIIMLNDSNQSVKSFNGKLVLVR
jgi:hypothetical protein